MIATIPCKSDDFKCPYYTVCIARINDRTIRGCGMALYVNGLIKYDEIGVNHLIKEGAIRNEIR
jgi:hypothetical protein